MLDLIGTTLLTAAIAVNLNATITTLPLSVVQKLTTVTIAGLWIGLAIALATTGIYASQATPVPVVGVMVGSLLIVVGGAALLSARVREALLALPVPLLVGLNTMRIIAGGFMVLLALQGRLSGPFPQFAGCHGHNSLIVHRGLAHDLLHQARRTDPSNRSVQPHWRNGLTATVNRFTGCTQIRHFVMAITGSTVWGLWQRAMLH